MKKPLVLSAFLAGLAMAGSLHAQTPIKLLNSKSTHSASLSPQVITALIQANFDVNQFREVRVQVIVNKHHQPDHLLVYLLSKQYHKVDFARMDIDSKYNLLGIKHDYRLQPEDFAEQPGISAKEAVCPDPDIEFIAFAPNNWDLELDITKEVATAATERGYKTIQLLVEDATRTNYLNYMKCNKVKGNFYDGDADPELITTSDGVISYQDINDNLLNAFNYKVTNIWLACQAFNDPIKSSMLVTAQSQKYAAGINNLLVGPSDRAAACTMEAALQGKRMKKSFDRCYKKFDTTDDHWGWGGDGSNYFGQ